jgi:peroxiredoxin
MSTTLTALPDDLPAPVDDGAADHLPCTTLPSMVFTATDGSAVDLSALPGRWVVYVYPRTGQPGVPLPDGWDSIPGARGCTPQSCSFRDHHDELRRLGAAGVYGLSSQTTDYQREVHDRLHLPFLLLSDTELRLKAVLRLPTFTTSGMELYRRITLVIDGGTITKVFYPVFPPDRSAGDVVDWLRAGAQSTSAA